MKKIIIFASAGMPIFMACQTLSEPSGYAALKRLAFHSTEFCNNPYPHPSVKNEENPSPSKLTIDSKTTGKSTGKYYRIELAQTSNPFTYRIHITTKSNSKEGGVAMLVSNLLPGPAMTRLEATI